MQFGAYSGEVDGSGFGGDIFGACVHFGGDNVRDERRNGAMALLMILMVMVVLVMMLLVMVLVMVMVMMVRVMMAAMMDFVVHVCSHQCWWR